MNKWFTTATIFLLFLFPILYLFYRSISSPNSFNLNLSGWSRVSEDPYITQALIVTCVIGALVVLLNLLISIPTAKGLSHYSFEGKSVVETILLMPILIPSLAIAMGLHLSLIQLGWANTIWGVTFIHLLPTIPYSIRIFKSGFDQQGKQWESQANTLGVSRAAVFFRVTLPLLAPNIRSASLLVFVISLSQYALTAIIGGGLVTTLPMIYYPYFMSADQLMIATFSVIFAMLPLLFLTFIEICLLVIKRLVRP